MLLLKEENLFDFKTLNGVMNYKRIHASNINILAKVPNETKRYLFKAGSSLASLVPLTEREVIIEHHLASEEELRKLLSKETITCFFKRFIRQSK